ncbi:enoyl-CoA hydratase [Tamaricihabitans halophyticus]|uniref:Enoyl-CoA hydratase n=1 Tax=Tamaricihabitans halophyticus TaxID=1262583 RepID=A0A4V6NRC9_9PSEU|nr:enoyl-CoA hydratase [Tamaricihabitans halophyticus]TCP53466.1 enoyl-CoA hydratase [Tamaricihabitans halophyticus]
MTNSPVIEYDDSTPRIARIILNRPDTRNAQNTELLYALNQAYDRAAHDDAVHVIVLAAHGPHFSSGHDLRDYDAIRTLDQQRPVGTWSGFRRPGAEALLAREKEVFQGFSERWRNIPKPMLAEVQGKVISGGLMLVWPCDIIIASDDAQFIDNTVAMGVCGAEYFGHPWELGVRAAKELLFTTDPIDAEDAHRLGMVNHVVGRAELTDFTMRLARRIAGQPLLALRLAKEAVNVAQDSQGRVSAMQTAFAYHQLCHSHNMAQYGSLIDPAFLTHQFSDKKATQTKPNEH